MKKLRGTGVAVVTPFNEAGNIDLHALRRIIEYLIEEKVEYFVVLGTTGESVTLTESEQKLVIDTFFEVNQGRLPIVIGVGGNNTRELCQKVAEISGKYKPDALLSVSPYYNKPTQAGIYEHYKAIAKSTDLPIILYNVPGRTAANMAAATTLSLAHDFANIVAIKEASADLLQCMQIVKECPKDFMLISGDDILTLPIISIGGVGVISVVANALPQEIGSMVRYGLKGDTVQAQHLHYKLLALMNLTFEEGNPAGIKAIMASRRLCAAFVRLPLLQATEDLTNRIQKELTR